MTDPYRAMCAELVDELEDWIFCDDEDEIADAHSLIDRARAALAEPEAEGPSADELIGLALGREPWATWLRSGGCLESAHCELVDLMLAAIARWGRPAAAPVPEAEGPTDEELLASVRHFYGDQTAADMGAEDDLLTARAVLARWGGPR